MTKMLRIRRLVEAARRHHRRMRRSGNSTAYIAVDTRLCRACWKCVEACPKGVIGKTGFAFHKHVRIVKPGSCTGCKACVKTCIQGAIEPLRQAGAPR